MSRVVKEGDGFRIDIDRLEAEVLVALFSNIAGLPAGPRGVSQQIRDRLDGLGVRWVKNEKTGMKGVIDMPENFDAWDNGQKREQPQPHAFTEEEDSGEYDSNGNEWEEED